MNEDEMRAKLTEALRQRVGHAETGDREQDYRPGAPCMDCGDYPGPKHEGSDCPRAVARALLPTVRGLIADELRAARDEALAMHSVYGPVAEHVAERLTARADALAADTEPRP